MNALSAWNSAAVMPRTSGIPPRSPKYVYRVDASPPSSVFRDGFAASGFIPTVANSKVAEAAAEMLLRQRHTAYIYRVRADQRFYRAAAPSFDPSGRTGGWNALERIPAENIESVSARSPGSRAGSLSNPGYVDLDTRANELAYGMTARPSLLARLSGFLCRG
jgi:hypothetical protein